MNTKETKREYEKPTSRTIELQHRATLLQSSRGVQSMRKSYGNAIEEDWD